MCVYEPHLTAGSEQAIDLSNRIWYNETDDQRDRFQL